VRLATQQPVELLLVDATDELTRDDAPSDDLDTILPAAPSDVAVLVGGAGRAFVPGGQVLVPFGGAEHEWAAAELAAWLADAVGASLTLVGTAANEGAGRRDASRLLATASLVVQQVAGVPAGPLLVAPGPQAVVDAAAEAALVVIGLSERWRHEGIGAARLEVARGARPPVLLVRGGARPGGLAHPEGHTRYTWSLATT
jgi:hypothetical protein